MRQTLRKRIRVRGRVQGVGYRASTRERAAQLRLRGWVKNQPDGSVLLEAQGPAADVDALIAWCQSGPPAAMVESVEAESIELDEGAAPFQVRR